MTREKIRRIRCMVLGAVGGSILTMFVFVASGATTDAALWPTLAAVAALWVGFVAFHAASEAWEGSAR